MSKIVKSVLIRVLILVLIPGFLFSQGQPMSLNADNPHYFDYKGKPVILVTSGEHYGAVLNLDFDYIKYLDELKLNGLNLTRTFTGAYLEPVGAFNISKNTLAPSPDKFICPWLSIPATGDTIEKKKFDLTKWDTAYFNRLKHFLSAANERGVIIELALFCPFYDDTQWILSPMNSINNVNGLGSVLRTDVYTLDKNGGLLKIQETLVRKIVNELKDFDNLIFEICNEPYFGGVTMEWQHHIADIITEAEKPFHFKHLISQNIANVSKKIEDPHPSVSIFNFHYAAPPHAVAQNYHLNKVIGDNETGFDGNTDSAYRREAWEFLLAGGGLYNNLDYSFTAGNENGTFHYPSTQPGGGSTELRRQLGFLKKFLYRFDFLHMHPDSTLISKGLPEKMIPYALTEAGKQYAFYFYSSVGKQVEITLPSGTYEFEWMDPLTGKYSKKKRLNHSGGIAVIAVPNYSEDMALRIVRAGYLKIK
ncbi:MAG: cellulase family glycosylhydrolase [Chitinophagaceae bacterium]